MKWMWLILLLLWIHPVSAQSDTESVFTQANAAYSNHNFVMAVSLYELLVQSGIHEPVVYFNLGNAYFELGDIGRALANYRRTQQYWPRDPNLNSYLVRIRSQRVDLQGDATGFVEELTDLTSGVLTLPELGILVGIMWLVWFVLLAAVFLRRVCLVKLRTSLIVLGVGLLVGLVLLGCRLFVTVQHPSGVVIAQVGQVMSGPGDSYLELYQLHAAAEMRIWDETTDWVQFALPDGRLGWLPRQAVEIIWA
jgi:hypothetical protein